MIDIEDIKPPDGFNWRFWVDRWDRMQRRYVVKQLERVEIIVRVIRDTQPSVVKILDLGCGPGSLMSSILEAFSEAQVFGIDFQPAVLWLAETRLKRFGGRSHAILADLRDASWTRAIQSPLDAVVTTMTLHWFSPDQLAILYQQIGEIIRPEGVFLNADHVGSDSPMIQQAWEDHRSSMLSVEADPDSNDWEGFWQKYSEALDLDIREIQQRENEARKGHVKGGLPLTWHFDRLREAGFVSVDCFWRCDCDAIYGGIRSTKKSEHLKGEA